MFEILQRLITEEEGQGMVEYGLILALIAIAVISVMGNIGGKLSDLFKEIKGEIGSSTSN